jgi:hypothetical protein
MVIDGGSIDLVEQSARFSISVESSGRNLGMFLYLLPRLE